MDGTVTDPIHQLKHSKNGVGLQGAAEHAELHRVRILQIDAGVPPSVVALLSKVQNVHGVLLVAVPGRPPLQLPLGTAAELQQLLPVLLEEVEHPGDGGILFGSSVAKSRTAHMDMEPAGAGPVTAVAQREGFFAEMFPGHVVKLAVQGQRMSHQFKALVQRAVVLDVHQRAGLIGDVQQFPGIVRVLTAFVQFQFHTEKPGSISVENGLRFEVVVVDGLVMGQGVEAVRAVWPLVVFVRLLVVGGGFPDQGAAAAAAGIVIIIAGLTERGCQGSGVIAGPDPFSAVAAKQGIVFQTDGAYLLTVKVVQVPGRQFLTADLTGVQFSHGKFLL